MSNENNSFIVYNNTKDDFTGCFVAGAYNGKEMKAVTSHKLTVSAGKTANVNEKPSDYSEKYFIWKSIRM